MSGSAHCGAGAGFGSVVGLAQGATPLKMGGYMAAAATQRTTHRSSKGTKLYAVRDAKGRFKDIQTYKRAHRADLKRKAKKETAKKH